ncbi:alpha-mannosyltransferase [Colletotrichum chrysophilum]|uniref:Alpha-mannosyltransferase n=1 Tax=Colletotrichum chrysophilum TaxID=1836956 RepID=A0AAD9AML5_9PEZI|nr:alpha-mannosyltransferase [Colletotrichum chrysophilum]
MVSQTRQKEEPPQFYGGIVEDPMGLGKTLTMIALWKTGMSTDSSVLFSVRWRRIILDEAHYIRNEDSRMAQANKLGDLATLMKFIRVHPYTDTKQFDADLSRLWKPKTTINLPPRHDKLCAVDFMKEEREIYDQMRQQALQSIETAIKRDSAPEIAKTGTYYVNALQRIESLRLFCNLGLGYQTRHQKRKIDEPSWSDISQQCFDMERQRGAMICLCCSSILELTETMLDGSETTAHLP